MIRPTDACHSKGRQVLISLSRFKYGLWLFSPADLFGDRDQELFMIHELVTDLGTPTH
jgi:hypothetical protein